jgi:hypothetical protein
MGDVQTGQNRGEKKIKKIKIAVSAVQITDPKGFNFSNTAES